MSTYEITQCSTPQGIRFKVSCHDDRSAATMFDTEDQAHAHIGRLRKADELIAEFQQSQFFKDQLK